MGGRERQKTAGVLRRLFVSRRRDDEFRDELEDVLSSTSELYALLERVSEQIRQHLGASQAWIVLFTGDGESVVSGTSRHSRLPQDDITLLSQLIRETTPTRAVSHHELRRVLVSHHVALTVPLLARSRTREVVGYIFLSAPKERRFSRHDCALLSSIGPELIIAIQNAVLLQEVRRLNSHLQHEVDAATKQLRRTNAQLQRLDETKDEFISMASHQLRTPLTSIKGYLSMLIEGDLGKVSKSQKEVLEEAFTSSERMVRLIGDFLNVSRLQTGKFVIEKRPVDMIRLVQREVSALEEVAKARGLTIAFRGPATLPPVELDENKIQQVVMNFIDNAIYYSRENGTIEVALKKTLAGIECTVKDDGIGVPKAEQEGLFGKFFRASNARTQRPDGTGVGLFLAKRVVQDHGGDIIFHSIEGKGSTFGFWLPVSSATDRSLHE